MVLHSMLLGAGLSMDAFSVSLANGLHEPGMSWRRMCAIAGTYGLFQALMPMTGRGMVRFAAAKFVWFRQCVPFLGAGLLFWIGAGMAREGLRGAPESRPALLGRGMLLAQALATSIDALSAGFSIAAYDLWTASQASAIIAAVTFCDCLAGLLIGKRFGMMFAGQASICGGGVLILTGLETLSGAFR